jgi:hypothetical protein
MSLSCDWDKQRGDVVVSERSIYIGGGLCHGWVILPLGGRGPSRCVVFGWVVASPSRA